MLTPEELDMKALARAVIVQAIEDLTTWNVKGKGNSGACWHEVQDAKYFLTAEDGDYKEDRDLYCGLAGVDSDKLRKHIIRALNNQQVFRRHDALNVAEIQESGD